MDAAELRAVPERAVANRNKRFWKRRALKAGTMAKRPTSDRHERLWQLDVDKLLTTGKDALSNLEQSGR